MANSDSKGQLQDYMILRLCDGQSFRVLSDYSMRNSDGFKAGREQVYAVADDFKYGENNRLALTLILLESVLVLRAKGAANVVVNTANVVSMEGPFRGKMSQ